MSAVDSNLKKILDFQLQKSAYGCTWVADGLIWRVCSSAIMFEQTTEDNTTVEAYGDKPVNRKIAANPSLAYPENLFKPFMEDVPVDFLDCFSVGSQLASLKTGLTIDLPREIPMRHYSMPYPFYDEVWQDCKKHSLKLYSDREYLALYLEGDKAGIYIIYGYHKEPENIKIETAEGILVPACWRDSEQCYTKLRKEKPVKLPEISKELIEQTLGKNVDLKIDPEKPGKENDGTQGVSLEEAAKAVAEAPKKKKPVKEDPAKEEVPAPAQEPEVPKQELATPAEQPKEEPVEEVKEASDAAQKRTRKKADTTPVNDLTKVIEQLSGAVPENLSAEDVQKALRQLRDLSMAASRRAANIALAYVEKTEGAVKTLAAIKAAL